MFVTPGIVIDGELITTDLVEINLGLRILRGRSFYEDWLDAETFVKADPLGNSIDQAAIPGTRPPSRSGRKAATSGGIIPG